MGRPPKHEDGALPNRIREFRKRKGWTLDELADKVGLSKSALSRIEIGPELGGTELKAGHLPRIAAALGVSEDQLLASSADDRPTVPVKGYVGAGAQVFPIDDLPANQGLREVECPRGLDPRVTVAVQVIGDSMLPIQDQWVLFYSRGTPAAPSDVVGHLCVVKIAGDGPTLVKLVRRGYTAGRFNLISTNASPIEDVPLEWAARVRAVLPPDTALAA